MEFTGLLDNLPGIVYRCRNDRNWTMEFISNGCYELTGYQVSDLLNNAKITYNEIILPEDQELVWKSVEKGIQTRSSYTLEYRINTAEGKIKWVWEKGKAIYSPNGDVKYLEGFINDITEKKHTELLQHIVFELSKAALNASSLDEMYSTLHHELSHIIDVENFYVALYHEATNTISFPYHVDYKDKFSSMPLGKGLTGYVIRTKQPLLVTEKEVADLNSRGEIEIIGTPSKIWLGVPMIVNDVVFGVMAVQSYTDPKQYSTKDLDFLNIIAGQIATMLSRRAAEDDVIKQKAYLEQLFEASMEAIITIDNNGIVQTVNSEFTRLFGFLPEEIIGSNIDEKITTQEILDEALAVTRNAMVGSVSEMETRRSHKDGHLIDVSIIVTPIRVGDEIAGVYGIYRDITDRKKIEKNLIAAKERAEESDRLKSAFLSNMSHEIRTPMNAIIGFSTLLSDPSVTDEEKQEFIRIIKERGNDLMRIMDDIIDIAKIEAGQIKIEIRECQVNTLLSSLFVTMNEVRKKHLKTHVDLKFKPYSPDKDFTILTDGNRLRQVLTNLIENSFKFTDEGFVEFGYTFKTDQKQGPIIEFYVTDTGIGIPKEKHQIVFERFRQADDTSTRKYGGTGLGLTICKNLMSLLNGDIWLESEAGHGATFHVTIPLTTIAGTTAPKPTPKPLPEYSGSLVNKTLLVVEDEESNYYLLERILKRTGANVFWAKNGIDAISMTGKGNIDLVLMDIRMPVMDGYEATAEIRKFNKTIPIIAQMAYALKGEKERSTAAGCDGYISKPIDPKEFLETITRFIKSGQ
ncbi:MAG: PAS domain S-box protein [Bacteroidetes bacterium]|nr:PAS domain S-box protein [Bacteroidota bacterium]